MSNFDLSVHFFLQLAFILAVCRLVGFATKKVGQPQVVGEMIAGVLLGPSLFGLFLPDMQKALFPTASMPPIYVFSQMGIVLYMFLVGLEFDTILFQKHLKSAVSVSVMGIITPFILGGLVALLLVTDQQFFSENISQWEAVLFVGASMSITAFPMLARMIHERGLSKTSLGTLALAAGAIDDVSAWCILAIVLASFGSAPLLAVNAIGGGILYTLIVLTMGKRLLAPLGKIAEKEQRVSEVIFGIVLVALMLGAWYTDKIGIHAVFGGFVLGIAMPRGFFAYQLQKLLEPLVVNLLVPLFFVYSGLNTQVGLVDNAFLLGITLLILLVAVAGKGIACWFAARLNGENNRDAMLIGTLMNTRGMMELIILNIGLQMGIITPTFFTIMVIMAIVTTLMTSPIFEWITAGDSPSRYPVHS